MSVSAESADPVPVDVTDPLAVMTALGHATARAVIVTATGVLAIAESYPPSDGDPVPEPVPDPEPEPPVVEPDPIPDPAPVDPQEP